MHKSQNAGFGENINSCHKGDKAFIVHDPWEVRDVPMWEWPVVLMSACSESWKMAEHLHSCLELNKSNIPESERAATLHHLGDRKALQWRISGWNHLKMTQNGSRMLDMVLLHRMVFHTGPTKWLISIWRAVLVPHSILDCKKRPGKNTITYTVT